MPEERDDAAQEPEDTGSPEAGERQEPEAVPGEPGEATPEADEPAPPDPAAEAEEPAAEAEEPAAEEEPEAPADAEPEAEASEEAVDADEPVAEGDEAPASDERRPGRPTEPEKGSSEEELIPGAHLEPDLVLEEEQRPQSEYGEYGEVDEAAEELGADEAAGEPGAEAQPVAREPLALAADARYAATGKRKSAVARVILKPGEGTYTINSRHLDEYFPRIRLQRMARQPLETAGYQNRMDVVARIHGGGISAQATALRHGVARALVEADPALRGELKRRGYLTRDPRVKERKKAGLKKARKRPQFSKR
jgi:small subunit ribosomal protein S9